MFSNKNTLFTKRATKIASKVMPKEKAIKIIELF